MTGLQLVIAAGALIGAGLALLALRLVPAHPDLGETLTRLSPAGARDVRVRHQQRLTRTSDIRDVLGVAGERLLPARAWGRVSDQDLAILRTTRTRWYGEKVLFAAIGLVIGPVLSVVPMIAWDGIPGYVPVAASLVLGLGLWFVPTYNLIDDARKARLEFSRGLGALIDLVALERAAGSGPRPALEKAAAVGDSWAFQRVREELARTRWSGTTPWDALRQLGEEVGLSELHELADIMRLSGDEDAQVYDQLRSRSSSMRSATLLAQKAEANAVSERMTLPMTLLGVVFLAILITPQLLRLVFDGS